MTSEEKPFDRLRAIVKRLRDPNGGCPWDLEQTHQSLKPYVIEEAHEVVDAIDAGPQKLKDELGDLLLQVMLHSQIASEAGTFQIDDVVTAITEKMIHRHPHVFGDVKVKNSSEVLKNWEEKKREKLTENQSILDGVPRSMPALLRGQRIGEKAARVGFEWPTLEGVRDKVFEEINEFLEHIPTADSSRDKLEDEFGDILFALTQLARRLKLNSEDLLNRASDKFTRRFKRMEQRAARPLKELSIDELDAIWEEIKGEERAANNGKS